MTLAIKMLKLTDLEKKEKTHEKYVPKTTSQEAVLSHIQKDEKKKHLKIFSFLVLNSGNLLPSTQNLSSMSFFKFSVLNSGILQYTAVM